MVRSDKEKNRNTGRRKNSQSYAEDAKDTNPYLNFLFYISFA
jgi:hypothetical protein